jgi:acetyltransferase-like isoleucine patch superfamily enzyme
MTSFSKIINFLLRIKKRLLIYYFFYYINKLFNNLTSNIIHILNLIDFNTKNVDYGTKIYTNGRLILDIYPESKVKIGNNVSLISNSRRCTASNLYSPIKFKTFSETSEIIIGNNVGLNGTSITSRTQKICIGDNTMIAGNVTIMDSNFHNPWPPDKRLFFPGTQDDENVIIGKNCWIGLNSIILKGVNIGDNSVIGAGSLVLTDIPPNCLAAGNPAKVIKYYKDDKL